MEKNSSNGQRIKKKPLIHDMSEGASVDRGEASKEENRRNAATAKASKPKAVNKRVAAGKPKSSVEAPMAAIQPGTLATNVEQAGENEAAIPQVKATMAVSRPGTLATNVECGGGGWETSACSTRFGGAGRCSCWHKCRRR